MQIQPINNFSNNKRNQNLQFKSVIPVVHWLAETNGSFSPQITTSVARELNENIISRLNTKKSQLNQKITLLKQKIAELTEKIQTARSEREKIAKEKKIKVYRYELADLYLTERVQRYVAGLDPHGYGKNPVARNFYNQNAYNDVSGHKAAVYIATGKDALHLDDLGRNIGMAYRNHDERALERARSDYWSKGGAMVEHRQKEFKMPTGEPAELHIKMEILRDITGKNTGYNIIDMRRFPKEGPNNPFALIDWMKNQGC